ncbi:MlaA family lipoprotein [Megalodesulfovibrio gigas]|uniref:Putative VacJ family lipoprotein n=1 Tax=Megalodesulfovibrio gigas (strain ATCC 19364 / DSM 1382 / NCIMB 9332 / VKM B-1759) TaxID=1121448 RepID=T2GDW8_MEGG1|nr:VacJ family lipoprotein [Megalodesulfovibrio gigas]AGW14077.1 putative VacJ family lipoprotein [Megalodesulfovibrio gigas DSM 1382 = ATCC 19364]
MHTVTRLLPMLLVLAVLTLATECYASQPAPLQNAAAAQTSPPVDTAAPTESDFGFNDGDATVADPLQPWNQFWFGFNDYFYQIVMQPLGKGYNFVTPVVVRSGIRNVFHNLLFPVRFINCILQGKFLGAGVQLSRFVGNTAFGVGGFFNHFDTKPSIVPSYDEDFGQTLASWGVGDGFYLVMPILGPTTLRDGFGITVDLLADPVTYLNPWPLYFGYDPSPFWVEATVRGGERFNKMAFTLDEYDRFKQAAVEPYSAMRDAYIQNRKVEIGR